MTVQPIARMRAEQAAEVLERGGPVLVVDEKWRFVYLNPALERLLGVGREGVLGRGFFEVLALTEDDALQRSLERAMKARQAREVEAFYPPSGRWLCLQLTPLAARGLAVFCTDITARRRRDTELRVLDEAGRLFAQSLDLEETVRTIGALIVPGLADWYWVDLLEPDGSLRAVAVIHRDPAKLAFAEALRQRYPVDVNAGNGIYEVIRSGRSKLVARVSEELLKVSARDAEHLQLLRALAMHSWMCVPLTARGHRVGALSLVMAESGRLYGDEDLAFAENLAGRAALAIDNARLYQQAQAAVRIREEVLAVVSHDLKSPLAAVNLAAGHLWRWAPNHEARRLLENIQHAAARMNRLLLDLLDMARISSGQFSVELAPCDLHRLIMEACEMLRPVAEELDRRLQIECRVPAGVRVRGDRNRLLQVMENLLSNAVKFSRPGDLIIVLAEPAAEGVRVAVQDSGQGIPPESVPKLFESYWSGSQHRALGAGLGLYISRGILLAHGVDISVESKVGRGSTFSFILPLAEEDVPADPAGRPP